MSIADDTLKQMEVSFDLAEHGGGSQLWTRELARKIALKLSDEIEALSSGDVVVIDMRGVEVFDYSFANELFGKTLIELPHRSPGVFLMVENLKPYPRENLQKALESLGLAIIEKKGKKLTLLGKLHPTDQQTFDAIVKARRPVAASALKDELQINLTAVNERLSKLTSLGLLRREVSVSAAGREQYSYSVTL